MAHRGRLNVLANVMAKPHRAIFNEFKGGSFKPDDVEGSGDVKYHLGASSDRSFDGNNVHLSLTANPSHLEIVDPVVLGKVRAKQDQRGCTAGRAHAGAAAADPRRRGLRRPGRGGRVLRPVGPQGSPHRRLDPLHHQQPDRLHDQPAPLALVALLLGRRASMVEAPIFHVNGDNPEAVVHVAKIATEFRQKFQKPVVIDMFCYRRYGHNESDEPMFTQPLMYKAIKSHPTRDRDLLQAAGRGRRGHAGGESSGMQASFRAHLDEELATADSYRPNKADWLDGRWSRHRLCRRRCAPRQDRRRHRHAARTSAAASPPSRRTSTPTRPCSACCERRREMVETGARHRLVDGRAPGLRHAAQRRLPGAPVGPGQRARHLLAAPFGADRPGDRAPLDAAEVRSPRPGAASRSSTRCCRRRRCSASSTATRWPSPTRSSCGRRSSATSPTARRSCSTSSSRRASASGCACRASCACCRTATRARGRSIPRRVSSASCSCAPRTTGRSPTARRRPTTSTSCAGSCTASSASR